MKLGELWYELGFKSDDTKLADFIKSVGDLDMSSVMAATGVGALYEAVKNIMEKASAAGMEMNKYSVITGMSAQQMDSWSKAAEQQGVQAGVIKKTFEDLQSAQAKAKLWGMDQNVATGLSMIQNLGKVRISVQEYFGDITKYYDKVREGIKGLDAAQQRQIIGLLGMNEQNLLFMKSSDEIYAKRNQQDTINAEEVKKLSTFWTETVRLGQEMGTMFTKMGAGLSEILTPVLKLVDALSHAVVQSRALQGVLLGIAFLVSALTGNVWGMWASGSGLAAYSLSNRKKIGELLGQMSSGSGNNPLGLPDGVHMGLPPGVGYSGPVVPAINATFHFNHIVTPEEMKQHALYALNDTLREAKNGLPPKGF